MLILIVGGRSTFPSMIAASLLEELARGEVEVLIADGHGAPDRVPEEKETYLVSHGYEVRRVVPLTASLMLRAALVVFVGGEGPIYPGRRYERWVPPAEDWGESLEEWIRQAREQTRTLLSELTPAARTVPGDDHHRPGGEPGA